MKVNCPLCGRFMKDVTDKPLFRNPKRGKAFLCTNVKGHKTNKEVLIIEKPEVIELEKVRKRLDKEIQKVQKKKERLTRKLWKTKDLNEKREIYREMRDIDAKQERNCRNLRNVSIRINELRKS